MKFTQTRLENGLKIITAPMDSPAVTVLVMVETGSKYENKKTSGLSHFLEHMVFKGTPSRPKAIDIARELESIGAQYNAFTSQEYTGYYAKVSPEHIDTALDVVSDIYQNPLLDEEEIEKEKGVIVEEIRMYQDIPNRHVHDVFMGLVYGDQPAGWNIAGDEDTVKAFKREDFKKYMEERYVAEATTVVVAGSFDEKDVLEKIKKYFQGIRSTKKIEKVAVEEKQDTPNIEIKFKDTDQTHLVLGMRSFEAKSEDDGSLSVLAGLLGKGMSSRLFQKLREEMGVGYYINAENDSYTDHGIFTIYAGVDTKRIEEVIKTILEECKKVVEEPISEEELKKVKDYLTGSFVLSLETSDSMAEHLSTNNVLRGKLDSLEDEIAEIQKVTIEDVKKIAKKIFVDNGLNLAIIGPYKDSHKIQKVLSFK